MTTTTPIPLLSEIDRAAGTLRAMRHAAERHDDFADPELAAYLAAAVAAAMHFRLLVLREGRR